MRKFLKNRKKIKDYIPCFFDIEVFPLRSEFFAIFSQSSLAEKIVF